MQLIKIESNDNDNDTNKTKNKINNNIQVIFDNFSRYYSYKESLPTRIYQYHIKTITII